MSAGEPQPPLPEPRPRRSPAMWAALLIIWILGLVSFLFWFALFLLVLLRILA
jgi:hypothetical protein